jgi:hypothetical protein
VARRCCALVRHVDSRQRTEITKPQRDILARLNITPPKKIVELGAHTRLTRVNTRY